MQVLLLILPSLMATNLIQRTLHFIVYLLIACSSSQAQTRWQPDGWAGIVETKPEARPYTRWWWMGSAVDEFGLEYYAKAVILTTGTS